MIALSSFQSPEITAERIVEALEELIQKVSGETADGMMQTMAFYAFSPWGNQSNGGKDMKPIKDFMTERAILTEEKPKEWQWMPLVVRYCLMEERTDDAINLINRLCQWQGETKGTPQVNNFYAMFSMSGGSSGPLLLSVPTFPPKVLKGVPADFLSLFPVTPTRKVEGGGDTGRNAQLRASLQLRQDMENEQEALPKLGKLAAQIKNPALRALIYLSENQEEEAKKLIEKMFTAQEESALLFAAGYFFDRDDLRAYEALLKVRMLPLSRASRKKVDGHLAFLGSLYAEDKDAKLDLEPAKRAALRLRRVLSMNEREALGTALVKLGLKNEAKRLASVPNSAPLSLARGRFSSRNQQDRITELKKAGNIDGAAREAAKQFRMLSANAQGNEWEFRELVEKLSSKELKEETLKKLDPGESNSKKRLLEFARAQELLGTKEKAREIYEKLLAKDSDLVEALVGSIRNTPFDKVDQERIVVKKEGKIDVAATGQIFDSLWASAGSKDDFSHSLGLCQLTTSFLEARGWKRGAESLLGQLLYPRFCE